MAFAKDTFSDNIRWLYLADEAKSWLARLESCEGHGTVIKDYPKRSVFLCDGVYVKEVRYQGLRMLLKGVFGGNVCREGEISRRLASMNVSVPEVLGYGVEKQAGCLRRDLLLTRAVRDGRNLLAVFFDEYPFFKWEEKAGFVRDLAGFIKSLHDKGVSHKDPNLGNIVCQKDNIRFDFYLIDTDQVVIRDSSLTEAERIENLALLHSLHNQLCKTQKIRFLKTYLGDDTLQEFRRFAENLERSALKHSLTVWSKNARKCLSSNMRFIKLKHQGFNVYRQRTPEAEALLNLLLPDPDAVLDSATSVKNGRTVSAVKVCSAGKNYFLKRYNYKGLTYGFRNAFRASRAVKTWVVFWEFRGRRLAVPEPLVCLEERRFRFLRRSYLLTEFIENSSNLKNNYSQLEEKERVSLLFRIAVLLGKMHRAGAVHNDLKWDNLLLQQTPAGLNLFLTDLDGARISHRIGGHKPLCKDISRFMRDFDSRLNDDHLRTLFLRCWWRWARGGVAVSVPLRIQKDLKDTSLSLQAD